MRLVNKIARGLGVISLSALTLLGGCKSKVPEPKIYLIPGSNMSIGAGDFDDDGDKDYLIIDCSVPLANKLYFFENDGKGNFTLKITDLPDYYDLP